MATLLSDPQQYNPRDLKVMSDSFTFEKEPTLSAMGNKKPYLIKIDVCEGKVIKEATEAGYFPAGIQMIRLDSRQPSLLNENQRMAGTCSSNVLLAPIATSRP